MTDIKPEIMPNFHLNSQKPNYSMLKNLSRHLVLVLLLISGSINLHAQFMLEDTTAIDMRTPLVNLSDTIYPSGKVGGFVPGRGFQIVRNEFAFLAFTVAA